MKWLCRFEKILSRKCVKNSRISDLLGGFAVFCVVYGKCWGGWEGCSILEGVSFRRNMVCLSVCMFCSLYFNIIHNAGLNKYLLVQYLLFCYHRVFP